MESTVVSVESMLTALGVTSSVVAVLVMLPATFVTVTANELPSCANWAGSVK